MTDSSPHALILVVEDDVLQRMETCGMFQDAGFSVLEAGDAGEALRFLEANREIALLVTDINLPGSMSGSHLARYVSERWPQVAIIVVSGRPPPGNLLSSMAFCAKPYEPAAVLRQARKMTRRIAAHNAQAHVH